MSNYTNFAFIDGDSLVVLERCGHPAAPVFGPVADVIKYVGASRPSADVATVVFGLMRDDTESEWSLADRIRRNDRKVLVIDIRNDEVTLYDAAEGNLKDKVFSMNITEFANKYGSL